MSRAIVFDICVPGEYAAGIRGFTDIVTITVDSGDPGGSPGEFEAHMRLALVEWYDSGDKAVVQR